MERQTDRQTDRGHYQACTNRQQMDRQTGRGHYLLSLSLYQQTTDGQTDRGRSLLSLLDKQTSGNGVVFTNGVPAD